MRRQGQGITSSRIVAGAPSLVTTTRRNAGEIDSAAGWGPGDHLCWGYDSQASWQEAVVSYLADGAAAGEELIYVAAKPHVELVKDLAALPFRDVLMTSGRLTMMALDDVHSDRTAFGPARQVAAVYLRLGQAAAGKMPAPLRLACESTSLIGDQGGARDLAHHELAADAAIAAGGLSVMCGYDKRLLGAAVGPLASVHPLRHGTPVDFAFHAEVGGWCLAGEVDLAVVSELRAALGLATTLPGSGGAGGDVHLWLDGLTFIDTCGVAALIESAVELSPERRLILHDAPSSLTRILDIGWGNVGSMLLRAS